MKSPDLIKKALKHCIIGNCPYDCPYADECDAGLTFIQKDCLEYIEQLEAELQATKEDFDEYARQY